jgi:poly(3-hydroxybutyrate) depolymerase
MSAHGAVTKIICLHSVQPYNGRTNRDGDVAYAEPSIDSWRQGWAQRVGCAAPPAGAQLATTTTESPFVASGTSRYTWKCPQGDVVGYTIQSMGHYWLSSNDVISATQISLEFFGNHTLVSS